MCGHTILSERRRRQQVLQDLAVLLEGTLHFLPGHEFAHLLGEFPEFLKRQEECGIRPALIRGVYLLSCCHCDVISVVAAATKSLKIAAESEGTVEFILVVVFVP